MVLEVGGEGGSGDAVGCVDYADGLFGVLTRGRGDGGVDAALGLGGCFARL